VIYPYTHFCILSVQQISLKKKSYFLLLHRALWNLYIVHSPTNVLFIKLGKV